MLIWLIWQIDKKKSMTSFPMLNERYAPMARMPSWPMNTLSFEGLQKVKWQYKCVASILNLRYEHNYVITKSSHHCYVASNHFIVKISLHCFIRVSHLESTNVVQRCENEYNLIPNRIWPIPNPTQRTYFVEERYDDGWSTKNPKYEHK